MPLEVRRTLAASYHDLLTYKNDMASFKRLDGLLYNFLNDSMLKESGMQTVLSKNLTQIVMNYYSNIDVAKMIDQIL